MGQLDILGAHREGATTNTKQSKYGPGVDDATMELMGPAGVGT